jgi:hypothetical protein
MGVTRRIAAAAILAYLPAGFAPPASAAPNDQSNAKQMSGHYIETSTAAGTSTTQTNDWYVTPCGDGCASVAGTPGGQPWGQAKLANGQWTMEATASAGCTDGSRVDDALSSHYTWDPNSLAGTSQNTYTKAACGFSAGTTTTSNIQFKAAEAAH